MIHRQGTSTSPSRVHAITIVGGGFSGAAVAYHLARRARSPLDLTLFDPAPRIGRGLAYAALGEHLLLNVPASRLSIDPARPSDFLDWCHASGREVPGDAFLPRAWFGEYTEARLTESVRSSASHVTFRVERERVVRVEETEQGLSVLTEHGAGRIADHVVLALGHGPSRVPAELDQCLGSDLVLRSPWDQAAMSEVASSAANVVLVGTGLTMCDAAISLVKLGFRGELVAVSRRGQLPRMHGPSQPQALAAWRDSLPSGSLRALRKAIRIAAKEHGWRSAVDALRPRTPELWAGLGREEQSRFLARLAPYWDAHRHRMPPETAAAIGLLRESGTLRVLKGRITHARPERSGLVLDIASPNGARPLCLQADRVILCTGPQPDPSRWGSPLVQQLIDDGIASVDSLRHGLRATPEGFLVGRGAVVRRTLSILGPPRRGSLWESTAVPELASQATRLAEMLLADPSRSTCNVPSPDANPSLCPSGRSAGVWP